MAYTTIDDPSAHFQTALYTGTGSSLSITNDGNSDLQPDMLWGKNRSSAVNHILVDSTRGVTVNLTPNSTSGEATSGSRFTAFNSDGFSVGTSSAVNTSGNEYVVWGWKANGGTTSTNNDGSKPTTVQANTDAGFSILTFTTNGTDTFGHGLGVKPSVVIAKPRSPGGWIFMTDVIDGSVDYGTLQTTNAFTNTTYSAFTSSVFQYNDSFNTNTVAYCFAEKQGFSKFGTYTGNGNANGAFVYTGFRPAFVLLKSISSGVHNWFIFDSKRGVNGAIEEFARPNSGGATTSVDDTMDILSNGFKIRTNYAHVNTSTHAYIYMAFAENPFVTSTGIPTTAR